MAIGKQLTSGDRGRVETAVATAERLTGLRFHVYVGRSHRNTRAHAERILIEHGQPTAAGILIFVAPRHRRVEVVTTAAGNRQINDQHASRAVEIMLPAFRQRDWVSGLELGLAALSEGMTSSPPGEMPG